jgi:hypothetical protein
MNLSTSLADGIRTDQGPRAHTGERQGRGFRSCVLPNPWKFPTGRTAQGTQRAPYDTTSSGLEHILIRYSHTNTSWATRTTAFWFYLSSPTLQLPDVTIPGLLMS